MVEGLRLQAAQVPQWQLYESWRKLTRKPFPQVKAFRLSDRDFNNVLRSRDCIADQLREIEEWGRVLSIKGTDACIFNGDEGCGADYIILIRQKPYHSVEEILLHELAHIERGDL